MQVCCCRDDVCGHVCVLDDMVIGYAIEFDRTRSDVIGLLWNDIPRDYMTQEYWLR
jgi:hypothetical protein